MNTQQSEQEELDLRAYLRPIWRRKWIILAIVVIAAAATYFISARQHKQYVASTKLYVQVADPTQDISSPGGQGSPSSSSLADVAQLTLGQGVTNAVSRQLGMPVSSAGSVNATPQSGSDFVIVTATSRSPELAARLANTYVTEFLHSRSQSVAAEALANVRAAQRQLAGFPATSKNANVISQRQLVLQQIQTYQQIADSPSAGATQVDPATAPGVPASPHPRRDAIFGGVLGLLLGVIAAFCIELLDRRLARVATVESIFGRPVLAVLPHVSNATPGIDEHEPTVPPQFAEVLRSLTVLLRLSTPAGPPRTIMVTSTVPREGKSTITRDLALVYAESGQSVLVIDGDLRRPTMERLFSIEAQKGLAHVLRGEATLSEAAVTAVGTRRIAKRSSNGSAPAVASRLPENNWPSQRGRFPRSWSGRARADLGAAGGNQRSPASLYPPPPGPVNSEPPASSGRGLSDVADAGEPGFVDVVAHGERLENPLPLLASKRMVTLFEEASQLYDIILLDTAPVLAVADSVPLMEVVDSVLLVVRLGRTTRHAADRFKELVARLPDVNFSGVIANDKREKRDDEGYGYGRYGYSYKDGSKPKDKADKADGKQGTAEERAGTPAG